MQALLLLATSTSRIDSDADTLTISGNIINGSIELIISGAGDTTISGIIGKRIRSSF